MELCEIGHPAGGGCISPIHTGGQRHSPYMPQMARADCALQWGQQHRGAYIGTLWWREH